MSASPGPTSLDPAQGKHHVLSMFDLRIETAPAALKLLQAGWPTCAVSLVGDDLRFDLTSFGDHHLILRCHDVEEENLDGFIAPSTAQLMQALQHTRDLSSDSRLLVHCHAGKSRSPAMAIGILIGNGYTPADAFERVRASRPFIIPNRLIIKQLDSLLSLRGELMRIVDDHYSGLPPEAALPDRGGWNV